MIRKRRRCPSHPGRILRMHYLEPLSITIADLATILGVSRKTLSKILNEHGSITSEMALRLSRAFNTSPELWLQLQKNYDLWYAIHHSKGWQSVKRIEKPVFAPVS